MKNQHLKYVFELSLATLFISTSGALGKYIAMSPPVIIWWRSIIAALFIYLYCRYKKINLKIESKKDLVNLIIGGLFLAIHWITYFYALKLSNVAIGMLSLFSYPVITALLEPLFIKVKLDPVHLLLGFIVLIGIFFLAPDFNLESNQVKGILLGLVSALFYALRLLILKKQVKIYNGTTLMLYQLLIISIILAPVLYFMDVSNLQSQFPYILLLALLTTAIGHTLFIQSLKYFTASTASIINSTQSVFGIVIAYFFLGEVPSTSTFFGGLLILSTVIFESIRSGKKAYR